MNLFIEFQRQTPVCFTLLNRNLNLQKAALNRGTLNKNQFKNKAPI